MTPKERVIRQIKHKETEVVPFAKLAFEADVAERLNAYYGNEEWLSGPGLAHSASFPLALPVKSRLRSADCAVSWAKGVDTFWDRPKRSSQRRRQRMLWLLLSHF